MESELHRDRWHSKSPFQFHTISSEALSTEWDLISGKKYIWGKTRQSKDGVPFIVVLKVLSQTTTARDHVVWLFHWQRRNWSRWSRSPAESPHVCFCRMARFKSCCVPRSPRSKIYLNRIVAAWRIVINSWQQLHQSSKQILSETNKGNADIISIESKISKVHTTSPGTGYITFNG